VSLWRKLTTLTPVRAATRSIVCSTHDPFRRQETRAIHEGFVSRQFRAIQDPGAKKGSGDLRLRPAWRTLARFGVNRLEALKGDRDSQHSIRINDKWRICFTWREGNAHDVEIVDYH
jgi:proteic killer suppression protein